MYPVNIVLQCGTGIHPVADTLLPAAKRIDMNEVPHFPTVTVTGHGKTVSYGTVSDVRLLIFTGRIHLYEGHDPLTAGFPAAVAKAIGAELLILTNAAGTLNQQYKVGDVMIHADFINQQGDNAVAYLEADDPLQRFVDPKPVYQAEAGEELERHLAAVDLRVHRGVYVGMRGPMYETRAELKMLRSFGGDAIGMSVIPEATMARFFDLPIVGISVITNDCFGLTRVDHEEVVRVGEAAAPKLGMGVKSFIETGWHR
jgi:purine-nucleoside phosphorylase